MSKHRSMYPMALAAVLAWTGAATAQPPGRDTAHAHGAAQQPAMMGGMAMGAMMGGAPATMLRNAEALGLTPEQSRRLERLAAAQRRAMQERAPEMMRARAALMEAMSPEGELEAARAALERASALYTQMVLVQLRAARDARAVLTPEQRTRLDAMAGAVASGMMAMDAMPAGMMCPMMQPEGGQNGHGH